MKTASLSGIDAPLWYFAYGSNMSLRRLCTRVPSAQAIGVARLTQHRLVFHKVGRDGSGKCDIAPCASGEVHGVVYRMAEHHKPALDACEDLGRGYAEKRVTVSTNDRTSFQVFTYAALLRDASLQPYPWYLRHVLVGAMEHRLPRSYCDMLASIATVEDPDPERSARELSVYSADRT